VFSKLPGCNQWHAKGVYQIPYRSLYSRNIHNLFLSGRIISATHVAFGSTRVMATCAHVGQAVAAAAALCKKYNTTPQKIGEEYIKELQTELYKTGQHIPGIVLHDSDDLVQKATAITASSTYLLNEIPLSDNWKPIKNACAQMLPVSNQSMPAITFYAKANKPTTLEIALRKSSKPFNHTPDIILETITLDITPDKEIYTVNFHSFFAEACYAFVCFMKNENISLNVSNLRISGLLSVFNAVNPAVSNYGKQTPPENIGVDAFEFWCPQRRPDGQNIAMKIEPALQAFSPEFVRNGIQRPVSSTNAWVAAKNDTDATVNINWDETVTINKIELFFDTDYDHPLETVLLANPENKMVFCVDDVVILNDKNEIVATVAANYLTRKVIELSNPVTTKQLKIKLSNSNKNSPASLFEVRCY